jgi:hypothetical protein
MITLKGFVTISQYIDNTPNATSPLGELSTWSMTYTKERGEYSIASIPGYKLVTFKSVNESNAKVSVPDTQVEQILQVVQECINYASGHIRPYNPTDFRNSLLGTFFERIGNVEIGAFVDNGSIALPEYIAWTSTEYDNNIIKIWLADEAFANQYDEYEINVVPPITPLDNCFGFYNQAVADIQARTTSDLTNGIQVIKDNHPETYLRLMDFDYVNQNNPAQRTKTTWAILIYGRAGDQIDIIRDAMVQFILTHSTYSRLEWSMIYPDIFKRTEFIILPRWDKIAIPNLQVSAALYSSILNPVECVEFALASIDFYPIAWVNDNVSILPFDYKALTLLAINGVDNVIQNSSLTKIFPDYIPVSSTSLDFNRMTVKTREWVLLLEQLLIAAETATQYSSIPSNLRRIERQGIMFISIVYENVNYMVAARNNVMYGN